MGPILEQIHALRCPSCGNRLEQGMVRGLATEGERLLIQIACAVCGETTLAIVEQVTEDVPAAAAPITRDDVLDAHEFLRRFDGIPDRLFESAA